jgi:hypothetical protein
MIILRDPEAIQSLPFPAIRQFIQQRIELMRDGKTYDPDEQGFFILIEIGDQADEVAAATGCPLLTPLFEYVQAHDGFYELVYIANDSGFAHIVIVPHGPGIDPRLAQLCTDFA